MLVYSRQRHSECGREEAETDACCGREADSQACEAGKDDVRVYGRQDDAEDGFEVDEEVVWETVEVHCGGFGCEVRECLADDRPCWV